MGAHVLRGPARRPGRGGLRLLPCEPGFRFDRFAGLRPELSRPDRRGLGTAPSQPPSFYYAGLCGLGVGGVRLPLEEGLFELNEEGEGGVVMDAGTAVTRLPGEAYKALRDAFAEGAVGLPRGSGVSIFDTCYNLDGYESVRVPTVSFYFSGGMILTLPAQNFLIPVDDSGTFCFAFAPSSSGMSILGNIQQEGIQITLDSANGFVGFGPTTC